MMDDSLDASASDPEQQLITQLVLDLRGTKFTIERETLMNLPESVLLCLFPNGLVLSRRPRVRNVQNGDDQDHDQDQDDEDDEEEVYLVDFDPQCLTYVLSFFRTAQDDFYGTPDQPGKFRPSNLFANGGGAGHHYQQSSADFSDPNGLYGGASGMGQNPLLSKQAIIVLREELEYFAIPPKRVNKAATAATESTPTQEAVAGATLAPNADLSKVESTDPASGQPTPALVSLKQACGKALLDRKQIFTALQRNVNKENNLAEQHLIDMLCMR